ncbi:MAG: GyrI-like domain-containing protein [Armatimonadetes bacterium]|nr:GyrI-like domain-containing protein [Armatimonadota bacterium]
MTTLDLRKQLKHLYQPGAKQPALVDVPPLQFALVDGAIEPGQEPETSESFHNAIGALYGIAYTLKFTCKKRAVNPIDYPVMPLEALWSSAAGEFDPTRPDGWQWTVMIMLPDVITPAMFLQAVAQAAQKRPNPAFELARLETLHEGLCVQVMHVGPYDEEPVTIARMRAFAAEQGCEPYGRHHEIYLGDPRRSDPAKLKTVLRLPVRRTGG